MKIINVRHLWPERKGWSLFRKKGLPEYIFIHFLNPVKFTVCGERMQLNSNATVFLDLNTPYKIECDSCDLAHNWFHVIGDEVSSLASSCGIEFNKIYYPKNCSFITEIVKSIEAEKAGEKERFEDIISAQLTILFSRLSRAIKDTEEENDLSAQLTNELNDLRGKVFLSLEKDWSVSNMAKDLGISESRFYSIYKNVFNVTPNRDLITARIEKAKRLIESSNGITVKNLARECGYLNEFHFIRIFKKTVGMTPKKYAIFIRNS